MKPKWKSILTDPGVLTFLVVLAFVTVPEIVPKLFRLFA